MIKLIRLVLLFCFFVIHFNNAAAQTPTPAPVPTPGRTNIDETFYLNIIERRFTEENFNAATAVSTDADSGVNVQVGVGLSASRIDVHMRNIRGTVRFQGTLDRILNLVRKRPVPSQPDAP